MKFYTPAALAFAFMSFNLSFVTAQTNSGTTGDLACMTTTCGKLATIAQGCGYGGSGSTGATTGATAEQTKCICENPDSKSSFDSCMECLAEDDMVEQKDMFKAIYEYTCNIPSGSAGGSSSSSSSSSSDSASDSGSSDKPSVQSSPNGAKGIKYGNGYQALTGLFVAAGMGLFGMGF